MNCPPDPPQAGGGMAMGQLVRSCRGRMQQFLNGFWCDDAFFDQDLAVGCRLPFQLQSADKRCGPAQRIEGQQSQGVRRIASSADRELLHSSVRPDQGSNHQPRLHLLADIVRAAATPWFLAPPCHRPLPRRFLSRSRDNPLGCSAIRGIMGVRRSVAFTTRSRGIRWQSQEEQPVTACAGKHTRCWICWRSGSGSARRVS